mgnify:CR=1 FL=1
MELRLEEKDYNILYSGKTIDTDDANYRYIASFDPNSEDDYVEALIHDAEQNFIQSVIVDREDYTYNEIEGKPEIKLNTGTILRKIGYDRGKYVIKYNFLRKKAGSYETILVDENSDRYIGDYHVMPDGTIMDGASHEDSTGKILQVKELKYFIQAISPSRNEIRIVPQKIKDNKYINSFVNLQTRNNQYTLNEAVSLHGTAQSSTAGDSKIVYVSNNEALKKNMEGGTFFINNSFIEQVIPPTPPPGEGNLFEEVDTVGTDPLVVASRFVILEETTNYFAAGEKDFNFLYNHFTNNGTEKNITIDSPLPKIINFFRTRDAQGRVINTDKTIKDVFGASADTRGGKDNVLASVAKFKNSSENQPTILTLGSVSSRPQNVAFEYEWTIFGFDRNRYGEGRNEEHRYDPITGRVGGSGDIIIQGESAGTLTAKGTDKKQITIEIYGGDIRLGVALRISRPAADLESSVALPTAIFIQ